FRLANDPQPVTKIAGSVHHRVVRKRIANLHQPMIQREVPRDQILNWRGELLRVQSLPTSFARPLASSALHQHSQRACALLKVTRQIPNRPCKSVSGPLPMKHLTGIKRHCQIEIGCTNFSELHLSPQTNTDETWIFICVTPCQSVAK